MDLFQDSNRVKRARAFLAEKDVRAMNSDARFRALVKRLQEKEVPKPQSWEDPHGRRLANIAFSETRCTLQIDQRSEPEFAIFLVSKLSDIYEEYEALKSK